MSNPFKRIAIFLAIVLSVFILTLLFILKSNTVCHWLITHTTSIMPGKLSFDHIEGDLTSDIILTGVSYNLPEVTIKASKIGFKCNLASFSRGVLEINNLSVKDSHYTIIGNPKDFYSSISETIKSLSSLPSIVITRCNINNLSMSSSIGGARLKDIYFSGNISKQLICLKWFCAKFGDMDINITGDGQFSLQTPYKYEGNIAWHSFSLFGFKQRGSFSINGVDTKTTFDLYIKDPMVMTSTGELSFDKKLSAFCITGEGEEAIVNERRFSSFSLSDQPSALLLYLEKLKCNFLGGTVEINGLATWGKTPEFDLSFQAKNINPGHEWTDWPGDIGFQAKAVGQFPQTGLNLSFGDFQLEGKLLGKSIQASGKMDISENMMTALQLDLASGSNRIIVASTNLQDPKVSLSFDLPDPYPYWPPLKGHFSGSAEIKNLLKEPEISVSITGTDVSYGSAHIRSIHGTSAYRTGKLKHRNLDFKIQELRFGDDLYSHLFLSLKNAGNAYSITGEIETSIEKNTFDFMISANAGTWEIECNKSLFLSKVDSSWWELHVPVSFSLDSKEMSSFDACWSHSEVKSCIEAHWGFNSGIDITGDTHIPPLYFIEKLSNNFLEAKKNAHSYKDTFLYPPPDS